MTGQKTDKNRAMISEMQMKLATRRAKVNKGQRVSILYGKKVDANLLFTLANKIYSINATIFAFGTVYRHMLRMLATKFDQTMLISFLVNEII